MEYFEDTIQAHHNVHLTVVYFGKVGLFSLNQEMGEFRNKTGFTQFSVVSVLNEEFSRGKGSVVYFVSHIKA